MLSHSPANARVMGKLVADGKQVPIQLLYTQYESLLIETLRMKSTLKKNLNVLDHILGYFKNQLISDEKQEWMQKTGTSHSSFGYRVMRRRFMRVYWFFPRFWMAESAG